MSNSKLTVLSATLCFVVIGGGCGKRIPDPAVKELSLNEAARWDFDQEVVELNELTALSAEVAGKFVDCSGEIYLNGLEEVDAKTAIALAKTSATLEMTGLKTLSSPELAEKLALQQHVVFLNGLHSLDTHVAKALSKNRSGLALNGLIEIPEHLAEQLAKHQGRLWLERVRSLPDETIKLLLSHESPIYFRDLKGLSKKGAKAVEKQWGFTASE